MAPAAKLHKRSDAFNTGGRYAREGGPKTRLRRTKKNWKGKKARQKIFISQLGETAPRISASDWWMFSPSTIPEPSHASPKRFRGRKSPAASAKIIKRIMLLDRASQDAHSDIKILYEWKVYSLRMSLFCLQRTSLRRNFMIFKFATVENQKSGAESGVAIIAHHVIRGSCGA